MVIKENNMRNELDDDMDELESKFEDFSESLKQFCTKAKKYKKTGNANSSDMWTYHLENIFNELDDMVTELASFGEDNDIF